MAANDPASWFSGTSTGSAPAAPSTTGDPASWFSGQPTQGSAPTPSNQADPATWFGDKSAAAAPAAPAAPKAKGGLLGRAFGDVVSLGKGLPGAAESLVEQPFKAARDIGEYAKEQAMGQPISNEAAAAPGFVNTVAHVFSLGKLGNSDQKHLGPDNAGADVQSDKFIKSWAGGLEQSGNEIAHPTQDIKNYSQHPVAAFLNDFSSIAQVLGPVAGALGAAAKVGEGAEAGSLAARVGSAAGQGAEAAQTLKAAAGRIANPAGEILGAAGGKLGEAASKLPVVTIAKNQLADMRARAKVAAMREATLGQMSGDIRQRLGTRTQELNRLVPDRTEQGTAAMLAMGWVDAPGAAEKYDALLRDPDTKPILQQFFEDRQAALRGTYGNKAKGAELNMDMLQQAVDHRLGRLPADQAARLDTGEQFYRDLGTEHGKLAERAGVSQAARSEEAKPIQSEVDSATQVAAARAGKVGGILEGLRQKVEEQGLIKPGQSVKEASKEAKKALRDLQRVAKLEASKDAAVGTQSLLARFKAERDDALAHTSVTRPDMLSALRQLDYMQKHSDEFTPEEIASIHDSTIEKLTAHNEQQSRVDNATAAISKLQDRVQAARLQGTGIVSDETQQAIKVAQEHAKLLDQYDRAGPIAQKAQTRFSEAQAKASDLLTAAPSVFRPALSNFRDLNSALSLAAERALSAGDEALATKLEGIAKDFQQFGRLESFQNPLGDRANFVRENATLPSGDVSPADLKAEAIKAGVPEEGEPGTVKTVPFQRGTVPGHLNGHAIVHYDANGKLDGTLIISDSGGEIGVSPEAQGQGVGRALWTAGGRAGYDMQETMGAAGFTPEGAALAYSMANPRTPAYFRGGLARKGMAATGAGVSAKAQKLGFGRQKFSNVTETTFSGQFRKHLEDYTKYARGVLAQTAAEKFGIKPSQIDDVKGLPFGEMRQAMEDRGLVPWDPKYGSNIPQGAITHDTPFVEPAIAKALDNQLNHNFSKGVVGHIYDKLTAATYRDWLKLSPFYMSHMIGADVMTEASEGMTPQEMIRYGYRARQLLKSDENLGSLRGSQIDEESLNPEPNTGLLGRAKNAYNTATGLPRAVDELTRVSIYLRDMDKMGMSAEEAVAHANSVLGHINTLGPIEQQVIRRIFPIYPWMKQVAKIGAKLAHDHPVGAMLTLNLAEQAAQRNEKGLPWYLQGFDPLRILDINPLNLVNPIARAAAVPLGLNVAAHRDLSQPGKSGFMKVPSLGGAEYAMGHQFPLGKVIEPLTHTPDMARYDTGQLRFKNGQPEKSNFPDNFPTALKNFAFGADFSSGNTPKKGSPLARSQAKAKKAAATAAKKYQRESQLAKRRGVR